MFRVALFPREKHLMNEALKLSAAFPKDGKLLEKIVPCLIVFVLKMFTDDGIFMLLSAKVEVTVRVALYNSHHKNYIVKQNALLVYR